MNGFGYERHKLFLYKEDFNRFVESLQEVVNHVKTELMPDYDYDEFARRQEEWEAANREGEGPDADDGVERTKIVLKKTVRADDSDEPSADSEESEDDIPAKKPGGKKSEDDDDMAW